MQSSVVILFMIFAAACAKQDSQQKQRNNLNSIDSGSRFIRSKRTPRALPEVVANSPGKDDVLNSLETIESERDRLLDIDQDFKTFYGTPPEQLQQLTDLLAIKSQLKRKAASCNFRDICVRWNKTPFVTKHVDRARMVLRMFALNKDSYQGAMANGWLQNNCTELYENCDISIRVVTSLDEDNSLVEKVSTSASVDLSKLPAESSTHPPSA